MAKPPSHAEPPEEDQWGLASVEIMLEDLDFPRDGDELRDRIGDWRVPMPGGETLRMGRLLEPLGDRTFRSRRSLVKALKKRWPDLRDPSGPWVAQDEGD